MVHFNPVSALTCLLLITSCLTFALSDHSELTDREIIEYLWSLLHQESEKPDFDAMLAKLTTEEKVDLRKLWTEVTYNPE